MSRKTKLLSIGEMSKLTGASIRSLRYYEQIDLLTPALIDRDSGYRYYSFEQSYHIELIMLCTLLDIPLKELPSFFGVGDTMDYRAFLTYGREIAEERLQTLKSGLQLISGIEKQMDLADNYSVGQIYTRTIPEKYFVCKPCEPPLEEIDRFELIMSFADTSYSNEGRNELAEYGFMCEQSQAGALYYAFVEVPKHLADKNTKIIPAATYFCRQDGNSQIEHARKVFGESIAGVDSYIAIETEILTSKPKISQPLNELRVITNP